MDLSSSSSLSSPLVAVANRDSSSAEDDGTLSVSMGFAKEAALLFQSGKFTECVNVLNQLLPMKKDDPKVLHNTAITEFFQDGCSHPKKLLDALKSVKKRSEELACASAELTEAGNDVGCKTLIGAKGANTLANQISAVNSSSVYTDEFDTSVTMFNIAVIWFHLHDYEKSFSVLESLYQNIEPIDEATAFHICLLMLDVSLCSGRVSRSSDVINYMEKVFCANCSVSQVDNGDSAQQQSTAQVAKSSSAPSNSTILDASSDSAAGANTSENTLSRTLSEDGFDDESYFSSLGISEQNLQRTSGISAANNYPRTPADDSISTTDLRLKLHLCKVQFLLLTRNLKAAKREVKLAMNMARGKDCNMALFLKSQLEYARGNHRKAIKLLMAASNRAEIGISSIYYNDLGCIYYRLGKYHTSSVFFSKALSNSLSLKKERPLKLTSFSQDKSLLIVYNCGMQYLACGKPLLAARCFHKASLIFYNKPLLWLRMTECCLMALEKGLLKSSFAVTQRSEVRGYVIGKGKWRQLALEDGISRNGQVDYDGKEDWDFCDQKQPNLSMSLARLCLANSLHLLNCSEMAFSISGLSNSALEENEEQVSGKNTNNSVLSGGDSKLSNVTMSPGQVNTNGDLKEAKSVNTLNVSLQISTCDYNEVCRKQNHLIKQAVLADLAYVEMELGNPSKALSSANSLLKLPECSRIYMFLGNMYAAEALCLLNRPKEAATHLLMYLSGGNSFNLPYSEEDCERWRVQRAIDPEESNNGSVTVNIMPSVDESQGVEVPKPEEARAVLYADLAVVYALQGDIEQAEHCVMQALSVLPNNTEATVTAIYLDLVRGRTQEARAKLKQCSCIRYLPGNLSMNC